MQRDAENVKVGDIVLLRVSDNHNWPIGLVERVFPSKDRLVRKLELRVVTDVKVLQFVRPISEIVFCVIPM